MPLLMTRQRLWKSQIEIKFKKTMNSFQMVMKKERILIKIILSNTHKHQ